MSSPERSDATRVAGAIGKADTIEVSSTVPHQPSFFKNGLGVLLAQSDLEGQYRLHC